MTATGTQVKAQADVAASLMRRATYASVGVALSLIAAKTVAWLMTGSVAMLSTLLDSVLDAVTSTFNLVAVHHALQPADAEHRFGHGKLEPLSGLLQAGFITGSALLLFYEAVARLANPEPIRQVPVGIAVTALAIVLTIVLVRYQRRVVAVSGSVAINADSLHYKGDLFINIGVMASLAVSGYAVVPWLDPVVAIAVGGYLVYNASCIGRSSFDMLMDREMPEEDRMRIRDLAFSHPKVQAVHELRTRMSGRDLFIQMHIEMDGNTPLLEAHGIADQVERRILEAYPSAEVIIHQDPTGIDETHPMYR